MKSRRHFFLIILLVICSTPAVNAQTNVGSAQPDNAQPLADSASVIVIDKARFTLLTSQLIRMEYSPSKQFEDRASLAFINRQIPTPKYKVTQKDKRWVITTDDLTLTYMPDGNSFNASNLRIDVKSAPKATHLWDPSKIDNDNLKGTTRTLDQNKGWDFANKLENGIISRSGWALIDDSQNLLFDGNPEWNWVTERKHENNYQDWYFFGHGLDYKKALGDFVKVSGKIPLPPKYAFGYWWSRYWIYNDTELRQLVNTLRTENIPLDVLIIDMDWHDTYDFSGLNPVKDEQGEMKGWTGYTWNKQLFPNPQAFLEWTNKSNIKTALNLHPASGVPTMEEKYSEFAKKMGDTSGKYIPFDMSNKKWAQTYFDTLLKPMQDWGIDFWWLDWQQYLYDKKIPSLSNTWWLNYTFFTNMEKTGQRPMIFHRWGGLGNHRYPIGFSGDAFSTWDTLDFETYFTATAANQGYAYWSHDIGGHIGDGKPTDGEMYLRWIQFGVFSPILRTHSSKISLIERRPWMFPQQFFAMREAIQLRYQLAPYIYTAARKTYDNGVAFVRPLYYEYPKDAEAYTFKTEYFFGDDLIVAPITTSADESSQLAEKAVWLPDGNWFDMTRGKILKGKQIYQQGYTQDEIPLFAKAGAIIPENPSVTNLQTQPSKQILRFIPGAKTGETDIYYDDNHTTQYQHGAYTTQRISQRWITSKKLEIVISPVKGTYEGAPKNQIVDLVLPNRILPNALSINDQPISAGAEFDPQTLSTIVHLASTSNQEQHRIVLEFGLSDAQQDQLFNGNKGFLSRMVKVTEKLKYASARVDWGGTLPSQIYASTNVANKLLYAPENVAQLMIELNSMKKGLAADILTINTLDYATKQDAIRLVELPDK